MILPVRREDDNFAAGTANRYRKLQSKKNR